MHGLNNMPMENDKIPGPKGLPFLGVYFPFTNNPLAFLTQNAIEYKWISEFTIAGHRIIHLSHPDHIQHVFTEGNARYRQGKDRDHMQILFGKGLLTSDDDHWKKQRKLIQPVFHPHSAAALTQGIIDTAIPFIESMKKKAGEERDIHAFSLILINRIISNTLFSEISERTLKVGDILVDLKADALVRLKYPPAPLWLPLPANYKFSRKRAIVYDTVKEIIAERRKDNIPSNDILSMLMQAKDKDSGEEMSDEELAEELVGIYAAAHEPVSIALTYCLYLLAKNPEEMEKLRAETGSVLKDEALSFSHFKKLEYTLLVIREALRLYPPVWISGKQAIADDVIDGYKVKKGDNITFSPVIVHRHPELWPDPGKFDPSRFSPERMRSVHPYTYFPFGGGPKYCVGSHLAMTILQATVVLITRSFDLTPSRDARIELNPFTTLKPKEGIRMMIQKAKGAHA